MTHFKRFLFASNIFLLSLVTINSQNLLDYPNSLKYASYLFQTKQFELSSIEYERVVFLEPNDTLAKLNLIRSYRYSKDFITAQDRILKFFPDGLNNLHEEFSKEYLKIMLCGNQLEKAFNFLNENIVLNKISKAEYQLGILIMQNNRTGAKSLVDKNNEVLKISERFNNLNELNINSLNTAYKNPLLAASLSAIVPGSGKLYTGRWKDAIFSFLFLTSASWLTYSSINNNGFNFTSVLYGSVTLGFYTANVYGSSKSAKMYNHRTNEFYKNEALKLILQDP